MSGLDTIVFVPGPRVAYRKIGDGFVLVNIQDNSMLRLNDTGSEIWGLLDGRNVAAIAARIGELFDTAPDQALVDTREFLTLLEERGLIERKDDG